MALEQYQQHMDIVNKRPSFFQTWLFNSEEAGFLNQGIFPYDKEKCRYCGGCLLALEGGDNLVEDHAKLFPCCPFILQVNEHFDITMETNSQVKTRQTNGADLHELQGEMKDSLSTPAAQSCLQNGFSQEEVMQAIAKYNQHHGNSNFKGKDLCELIYLENEEQSSTEPENTTTPVLEHRTTEPENTTTPVLEHRTTEPENTTTPELDECNTKVDQIEDANGVIGDIDGDHQSDEDNANICYICHDDIDTLVVLSWLHVTHCPDCVATYTDTSP